MSELRNVRARDAVTAFVRAGGELRDTRGSHTGVKMPNGQIVTIPMHDPVKVGLLVAMIRKAGLTTTQFIALLKD